MKVRYKKSGAETNSFRFNPSGFGEVLTGDDSPFITELDAYIEALGTWKDMKQAFRDRDIIPDNYNLAFAEPANAEDRARGFFF